MLEKRNRYLDWIRGISGIMVVAFHYTTRYEQLFGHAVPWPLNLSFGSYGVLAFFVLSGYLTVRSVGKVKPRDFIVKRFFRLYPAFCVSMIITMTFTTLLLPELAVSCRDFFLNFTMVPLLFKARYVDGAYWTLLCELSFYSLAFVVCLFGWHAHIAKIILCWFISQLCILLLPNHGLFLLIRKANNLLYLHCFIIGTIIALFEERLSKPEHKIDYTCYGLFLVSLFAISQQFICHDSSSGIFLTIVTVAVGIAVVLFHVGVQPSVRLAVLLNPLEWIASISYPMYLLHQNIGYCIIKMMEAGGLTNEIFIAIPFVLILVMSWLMHVFVEEPFLKLSKIVTLN